MFNSKPFKPLKGVNAFLSSTGAMGISTSAMGIFATALKLDSNIRFPAWIVKTIGDLQKVGLVQEHNVVMFYGSVKNNKMISNISQYNVDPANSASNYFPCITVEETNKRLLRVTTVARQGIRPDFYTSGFSEFLQELKQQSAQYNFVPVNGWDKVYYFHILTQLAKLSENEVKLFDNYISAGGSIRSIAYLCNRGMAFEDMADYVTLPVSWLEQAFPQPLLK